MHHTTSSMSTPTEKSSEEMGFTHARAEHCKDHHDNHGEPVEEASVEEETERACKAGYITPDRLGPISQSHNRNTFNKEAAEMVILTVLITHPELPMWLIDWKVRTSHENTPEGRRVDTCVLMVGGLTEERKAVLQRECEEALEKAQVGWEGKVEVYHGSYSDL
ncbi:hypothetical protein BJ508DRAFT_308369 [Ascobolus immersus RN42]|uniref:Uncharacterized protein n=1 Tax=Ascobolus immersus RN42 TaxID=1160509 RepID=A0A3N4I5J3_ASCIM|nr:hypothetical protein BJ508DRAFT_308369 [Ascobolus immersus RN42]